MQTVEFVLQMVFHSIAAVHLDSLDNLAKVGCGLYKLDINCNSFKNVISQVVTQRHICFECLYAEVDVAYIPYVHFDLSAQLLEVPFSCTLGS